MDTHCLLCGGCADICPTACIQIVKEDELVSLIEPMEGTIPIRNTSEHCSTVLVKDESSCIFCGLCVQRCPTGVMAYE